MGATEVIIIVVVALFIFGAPRLPQIGDALGRSIINFKRALREDREIDVTPKDKKNLPPGGEDH